ncbi:unnamed protein product [Sphenostylis stenocarpa]|uniref:PH domain-containing protein n=1 Tax=Sphenostylis stenocarpa TaxID=92480 RepID=A0AA86TJD7_9FABA|nr:unnamed protein product [Sphenostylis stenocarpa]
MDASPSGEGSERGEDKGIFQYFGWVYHIGVNSVGREYCHLRFLLVRGKCVSMYKRDPHENPDIKPIRQGVIGATLVVEELGCRKVDNGDLFVVRFYSRSDEDRKGESPRLGALASALFIEYTLAALFTDATEEAQRWVEAFLQAKQQFVYGARDLDQSS